MKHLLLFLFLTSILAVQAQDKPDGPYKDYYDSGELKVVGQYKNKKRVGSWKSYHKNGAVSGTYSYTNGKRNKESIYYYEDGSVKSKTEKEGGYFIKRVYYESGQLQVHRQVGNGYYKEYLESGQLIIEANYKDHQLEGVWKRFDDNGNLEWEVNYSQGYRDGIYKRFYDNGNIGVQGINKFDRKNGEEKRFDEQGNLVWKGFYKDDKFYKTWTKFDSSGKKIERIKVKEDGLVSNLETTEVPDGVLEKIPVYPGCESVVGNRARKKCMTESVVKVINKNFNTDLGSSLKLEGIQRIIVNFKINKNGNVEDVKARAPHPVLEAEAIRVIKLLPQLKPGLQKGEPVTVPYSIPILFQVAQ